MARQIIDGKLYDTDKATKVICYNCGMYIRYRTELYKGISEWFKVIDNTDIEPIKLEEAKAILGENNIEKYIEYFGEPELA